MVLGYGEIQGGPGVNQTFYQPQLELNSWQNSAVCKICFKVFEEFLTTSVEWEGEISALR